MNRFCKFAAVGLALFAAWFFAAWFLAEALIASAPLERADAILVLGGSATYVERTQKAADLYKNGVARRVLLTNDGERGGWSSSERRNTPYVELARNNLIKEGVRAEDIEILEPEVSGTIYEAEILARRAEESAWRELLLVTSAYHTRRARWTFERRFKAGGVECRIGIESAPVGAQTPKTFSWWLSPAGWNFVAGEYAKAAYYWVYY